MKKYLLLSVVGAAISATAMAQEPTPIQVGNLGKAYNHYAHGYNSGNASGSPIAREDRDSVMVGSTMKYFVMPDKEFNSEYYTAVGTTPAVEDWVKWDKLKKITSNFDWKIKSGIGTLKTGTGTVAGADSALRAIEWKTAGLDTVRIAENPTTFRGVTIPSGVSLCGSDTAKIPVTVINQPNVMFALPSYSGASDRVNVICAATAPSTTAVTYDFPLTKVAAATGSVIDETGTVTIHYTITKDNVADQTEKTAVVATNSAIATMPLEFNEYGSYIITITGVSDRISVKCGLGTLATAGTNISTTKSGSATMQENQFNLLIMPQTKAGNTYHISNGYN